MARASAERPAMRTHVASSVIHVRDLPARLAANPVVQLVKHTTASYGQRRPAPHDEDVIQHRRRPSIEPRPRSSHDTVGERRARNCDPWRCQDAGRHPVCSYAASSASTQTAAVHRVRQAATRARTSRHGAIVHSCRNLGIWRDEELRLPQFKHGARLSRSTAPGDSSASPPRSSVPISVRPVRQTCRR